MRPSSKETYRGWLLFEKVTQDMRLTLGDRLGILCFRALSDLGFGYMLCYVIWIFV